MRVKFSDEIIEWHRTNLTMPHEVIRQLNNIRQHATAEGVGLDD